MHSAPYLSEPSELVECSGCGWDDDGTLSRSPAEPGDEDYPVADDVSVTECGGCGRQLDADTVVVAIRDRHGRCAQALADDADGVGRRRALDAALRSGQVVLASSLLKAA